MGYDHSFGILDGSQQILYTADNNLLITDAVITRRGAGPVTLSIWILTSTNKIIPIVNSLTLAADTNVISGIKGQALLTGDKIIAQASGSYDLLGDISLSIFGDPLVGTRAELAHLQMQSAYGASVSCGTCATGGKVIEAVNFIANNSYTITVSKGSVTISGSKGIQVHRWTQTPNWTPGSPPTFSGRVWLADLPNAGGSFSYAIPSSGFFGFSILAGNPSNSDQWDTLCCTWDKSTRTITAVGFS